MNLRLDFLWAYHALHDAILVDDERGAVDAHVGATRHFLLTPHTEGLHQCVAGVADEREWQFVFCGKPLVRRLAVGTHTYHLIACFTKR